MITAEIPVSPAAPAAPRLARRAWVEQVMGMPVSVHVRTVDPTRPDLEAGVARVFSHLRRVDAVLSTTGLVKGWAVAAAAAHLDVVPEVAYSIGAGGDVVVGAGPALSAAAPSWRIGVEDPRRAGRVARVVTVRRGAVATSGAAARGGHVVVPSTGRGVTRAGSASVPEESKRGRRKATS